MVLRKSKIHWIVLDENSFLKETVWRRRKKILEFAWRENSDKEKIFPEASKSIFLEINIFCRSGKRPRFPVPWSRRENFLQKKSLVFSRIIFCQKNFPLNFKKKERKIPDFSQSQSQILNLISLFFLWNKKFTSFIFTRCFSSWYSFHLFSNYFSSLKRKLKLKVLNPKKDSFLQHLYRFFWWNLSVKIWIYNNYSDILKFALNFSFNSNLVISENFQNGTFFTERKFFETCEMSYFVADISQPWTNLRIKTIFWLEIN